MSERERVTRACGSKTLLTAASTFAGDSKLGADSMEMTLIRMDSMLWMGFQRSSVVTTERGFDPMAGCEMAAQLARARENVASRTSSLLGVHGVHSGWVQDGDAHLSVRVHYTGGRGCKWGQQINRESWPSVTACLAGWAYRWGATSCSRTSSQGVPEGSRSGMSGTPGSSRPRCGT